MFFGQYGPRGDTKLIKIDHCISHSLGVRDWQILLLESAHLGPHLSRASGHFSAFCSITCIRSVMVGVGRYSGAISPCFAVSTKLAPLVFDEQIGTPADL
jgi:hypothetical protein